ncbi:MAG TPA: hypothetical protein DEO62_01740 [Lachnospiraceae bacterium]|jgi:uncharacterized protein YegL|nr:hypothetical protein [Lachnospiraceae bacterium]HBZ89730.1 hypothetical protein [Lachnospiraceae bacterium]
MNNNLTEMVFILDKSGSMSGMEGDTIGGFNSMIAKQKKEDGNAFVSTILFNNRSEVLHDRVKLSEVKKLTEEDYSVGGGTALMDALGDAIHHIKNIHKYAREEDVPANTVFVITTDGMENSSVKYSSDEIKKLIKKQKKEGWDFIFMASNIDAVETAKRYGIEREMAVDYHNDSAGIGAVFGSVSKFMSMKRSAKAGCMAEEAGAWRKEVDESYESGGKKKR